MSCHNLSEFRAGDNRVRPNYLAKAGDVTHGHRHNFDHMMLVLRGAVRVDATLPDGSTRRADLGPGRHVTVYRDVTHEITATRDDTLYWCVYVSRDPETGEPAEYNGWEDAFA